MKLKTEYSGCFNGDDFTQRGGELEELMVTITLCEYRNMVRELARMELQIEKLQYEKEKLEEAGKTPCRMEGSGERVFKRLTGRVGGVAGLAVEYEELFKTDELIDLLLNVLATYEDTGLTPEEIEALKGGGK